MSEFNEGDLVEAVKGCSVICGYLNSDRDIVTENVTHTPAFLRNNGWTVAVIEKATPPLPTEKGYYRSGAQGSVNGTVQLDNDSRWWWVGNEYRPAPERIPTDQVPKYMPPTLLEPVAATASIGSRYTSMSTGTIFSAVTGWPRVR